MKTENQQKTVHEKNEELREILWQMGLNVFSVGQLGRIDYLIVSHFEPDPSAPPEGEPISEDIAHKKHDNLFLSNP